MFRFQFFIFFDLAKNKRVVKKIIIFLSIILYPTAKNIKVKGKNIKIHFYIFSVRICLQQILSES